ncbi:glycerophosphoryl diester phosphodiesterase [Prosthecobacter fusiformis]|uniref:glycerophosphodiester phosphodiesterase n=1 Tax=Prosthecobacter fusiformis TaxID=48464 RepID=A0A4V3FFI2_9BACT|nr:glycerophosphodiester phosphodiesterase [Prosthecobacter fusiformis]TDU70903.1 glycerophosphoryl diester phosphodiesterase [Prosthecobacter fusiformis]
MSQEPSPLIIAHRGASGYLPEHTLEAKAMAHAMGAPFIEQDVVLSKDSVPVILHDIHVDTISDVAARFPGRQRDDGRFYALDFTLAELKQLRVTERFHAKTGLQVFPKRFPLNRSTFQIPTLEEELQLIQGLNQSTGREAGIYPEIKQPEWHQKEGHDISRIVLTMLEKYGYTGKEHACYVQCFEYAEVKRIREELGWKGKMIMLLGGGASGNDGTDFAYLRSPAGLAELKQTVDGIGPAISSIIGEDRQISSLVKEAHANGLKVHPYTLRTDELPKFAKSPEDLMGLLFTDAGVDGLFTDFPDVVLKWLEKK